MAREMINELNAAKKRAREDDEDVSPAKQRPRLLLLLKKNVTQGHGRPRVSRVRMHGQTDAPICEVPSGDEMRDAHMDSDYEQQAESAATADVSNAASEELCQSAEESSSTDEEKEGATIDRNP